MLSAGSLGVYSRKPLKIAKNRCDFCLYLQLKTIETSKNYFEPHQRHFTNPWKDGHRIVLVGYSVRDSGKLSEEHVAMLQHFGFKWDPHRKPLEPTEGAMLSALKVKLIDIPCKAPSDSGRATTSSIGFRT